MSTTIQSTNQLSLESRKLYNKDRNKGFMDYYKKQLDELHKSKDKEQYIIIKARSLLSNEEIYDTKTKVFSNSYYKSEPKIRQAILNYLKLIYKIAKEYFIIDEEREEEFQA
ncbi:23104_t:CDS:2 [Gigaspora margarita]|uniref:23104_t:CDS:1 n=1 Tax=Gigaspora margarita TaxID=4874 RepID=A0ABN7VX51_GIGMA|nr:23104_t:CDS:2 [Gigaspora margarita]